MKRFRTAILLIHGIAGGIFDLEELQRNLELNNSFDTYSYTLIGHDDYYDYDTLSYSSWLKQSDNMIEFLKNNGYKSIYVVGHSMGGVIASYLASKHKEIKKIVLLSPAFKYMVFKDNSLDIKNSIKSLPKILDGYSKKQLIARFTRYPINYVVEFRKLVKNCYHVINKVDIPILIIHGNDDLLAPITSSKYAFDNCNSKSKTLIKVSGVNHAIFKNDKKDMIINDIKLFLKNKIKNSQNIIEK